MAFLLTWHGTMLYRQRQSGALVHRPLLDAGDDVDPVVLELPIERLNPGFTHHLRKTLPELPDETPGALRHFRLHWSNDQRTVNFQQGTAFLSALDGSDQVGLFSEAQDWESFLPVAQADLDVLREILAARWIVRSSGAFAERPATSQYFDLCLGDLVVDLRYQVPFDLTGWPYRLTLLRDGWRVEQVCRYQPLVYYSTFGSRDALDQLVTSVRSLFEIGRYRGQIAVLTDHAPTDLAALLPTECLAQIQTIPFQPADRPGFLAARYLITDWPDAWRHQPLLYVDTDIVFDNDVTPMLHAVARSERIAAPVELSSPLAHKPSVGAALLQRDGCSPGHMAGFNSGTLGIPNLRDHAEALRLIRRIIANHSLLYGRELLPFADQEIANYVSFRFASFDTALISRFVRFAGHDAHQGARCGLVHFWPVPNAGERAQAMRDYLARLCGSQC
jgi:hypothetical protein